MKNHRFILLLALLTLSTTASAFSDSVLVSKDGITRIFDQPCKNASVLERVLPIHQTELRAGNLTLNGTVLEACWVSGKRMVFVIDAEGDLSRIPLENFMVQDGV